MKTLICPHCAREFVNRTSRHGFFEKLLSRIYIFPFRCQLCHHRFLRLQWGSVYRKVVYDRRELERVPVYLKVSLAAESGERCEGALRNLSMQGCGVAADVSFDEGSILCLALHVPNEEQPIVVRAAAVRNAETDHLHVEFLRVERIERERLRLLVKELQSARNSRPDDNTAEEARIISH